MSGRGRPRRFDRDEALAKAMDLFWRKGFDNTSVAELTSELGLSPPSLYAAFGSKEQLFREALELYARTGGEGIWSHVDSAPTAREAVSRVLRATAEVFASWEPARGCMVVLSALAMEGGSPAVCDELKARRLENITILQKRLERAIAEGELPRGTDTSAVASFYATVQHGMSIQARDGASRHALLDIADRAMAGWDAVIGA